MTRRGHDLAPEVVAVPARQVANWEVLRAHHTGGVDAEVDALGQRRSCGIGDDGVWRNWSTIGSRRGTITYQQDGIDQPKQLVPVRELIEWAAARLTADNWAARREGARIIRTRREAH